MIGFVLRRVAGYLATLAGAAIVIFLTFDLLARDPKHVASGHSLPFWQKLLQGLEGLGYGDFGMALAQGRPVGGLLLEALGVTLPLLVLAGVLAIVLGLSGGVLAARGARRVAPPPSGMAVVTGVVPVVVLALLFAGIARGTPFAPTEPVAWAQGAPAMLLALLLPGLAAALPAAGLLALRTRHAIHTVGAAPFIRTARAQGLTLPEAMHRPGRRNVAIAVTGGLAPQAALLVAGVYVAEASFQLPGLSTLIDAGIASHDFDVTRGGVLALVGLTATVPLLVDIARTAIDPRIATRTN